MEPRTKFILSAIVGAVLGGGVGYVVGSLIADRVLPPEYEEIESAEEEDESESEGEKKPEGLLSKNKIDRQNKSAVVRDYTQHFPKKNMTDLEKLAAKYNKLPSEIVNAQVDKADAGDELTPEMQEIIDKLEEDLVTKNEEEATKMIYIISEEEWANTEVGFKQESLTFYDQDEILTDEKDVPIGKPEQIVGDEALVSFGVKSNDSDVVYVRNETLEVDIEVTRVDKSYSRDVLGIEEDTRKSPRKRKDDASDDTD